MKWHIYLFILGVILVVPTCFGFGRTKSLIKSMRVSERKIAVELDDDLTYRYLKKPLCSFSYEYPIDLRQLDYAVVTMPIVMCAAPLVWLSGKEYRIARMDEDLYQSLERVRKVFKVFYPSLSWSGRIVPYERVKLHAPRPEKQQECCMLFSGGLDSTCGSFLHLDEQQLLLTLRGCDVNSRVPSMWAGVKKHVNSFAGTYGHKAAFASFNFYDRIKKGKLNNLVKEIPCWWAFTMGTLSHVGVFAPLIVQEGISRFYCAASTTSDLPHPYGNHPLIDNNLRFAGISVIHDGHEYDREEKVDYIARACSRHNVPRPPLRVCWGRDSRGGNCNRCIKKCLRTMSNIMVAGYEPSSFGFKVSCEKVEKRTRALMRYYKGKLDYGDLWHWQCTQRHAKEQLEAPRPLLGKRIEPYLRWIADLDLDNYTFEDINIWAHNKPFFLHLWKKGCDSQLGLSS